MKCFMRDRLRALRTSRGHKKSRLKQAEHERDFPFESQSPFYASWGSTVRKAVCRRCNCIMRDSEDMSPHGEFYHPTQDKDGKPHWCPNAGITFDTRHTEIVPFLPKARRRALKRMGIRP